MTDLPQIQPRSRIARWPSDASPPARRARSTWGTCAPRSSPGSSLAPGQSLPAARRRPRSRDEQPIARGGTARRPRGAGPRLGRARRAPVRAPGGPRGGPRPAGGGRPHLPVLLLPPRGARGERGAARADRDLPRDVPRPEPGPPPGRETRGQARGAAPAGRWCAGDDPTTGCTAMSRGPPTTSCCAGTMACPPTTWPSWWTMTTRASRRSCGVTICSTPRRARPTCSTCSVDRGRHGRTSPWSWGPTERGWPSATVR